MEKELPKVLAITLSEWRTDSSSHTLPDLFKFWKKEKVAQIYTKALLPKTPVCNKFFQISENAVIKSVFNRKMVGREVYNEATENSSDKKAIQSEQKLYKLAHNKKSWFLTVAREFVWNLGCWKSKALDDFVKNFDADVYFIPVYPVAYMGKIQRYILKKFPKPYVAFLADDNYSYENCGSNPMAYFHRFLLRRQVGKLAKNCDEMFTITKTEAEDTDKRFGTNSVILTKGIDYSDIIYEEKQINDPIKMVYTGSMIIGRNYSLSAISKALKEINQDGIKITLDIYSQDIPHGKIADLLNSNGCCFRGRISRDEVYRIQSEADIVIFVESLEKKHRYAAKLSFSTKLTDYFKSGKCIFAIGDETIAPIVYLKENDAAIVSTEYEDILSNLKKILENKSLIAEYGKKAFECGKRNHNEEDVKETFISTILRATR